MQIIIPMSGQGDRFKRAGYVEPKPLIEVGGKPMIEYVINMFPDEDDFLFICNNDHLENTNIEEVLKKLKPTGKIIGMESKKLGPVYATIKGKEYIKDNEPCIVNYCDFNVQWDYKHFKKTMKETAVDGCITCYKGFHPHLLGPNLYASVKTDEKEHLIEIREKYSFTEDKMDSWQSSGTYYFKSGNLVKKYFQMQMDEGIDCNGEYYVSLVYNLLKQDELTTSVYPLDFFCQWGTPEDMEEYVYWMEYFKMKTVVSSQ